jgi:hypothetical protein
MSRFDDVIAGAAQELMEWEAWLDTLSPEARAAELALIEWQMQQPEYRGPCVQAPAQRKRGQ